MVQRGSSLRFSFKARQGLRILGNILGKKLEGYEAVQPGVFGFVDHSHSAAAQSLQYAVMGESAAVQRIRTGHLRSILESGCDASQRRLSSRSIASPFAACGPALAFENFFIYVQCDFL